MKIGTIFGKKDFLSVFLGVVLSFAFVVLITYSASTISTNLATDGTLTVNGNSTFGDAATDVNLFTGTLQASTTALFTSGLTTYGNSTFGDAATDVNLFTGTLQASTTALFTSGLTTYGASVFNENSAAVDFRVESDTQTNMLFVDGTNDRVGIASSTPYVALGINGTTTSRDGIVIGGSGTPINDLLFGSCTVTIGSVTASTTAIATCTATGVTTAYKVFITPYITNPQILFSSASATAASTIQIAVYNTGVSGAIDPADNSWAWLALR